MGSFQIINRKLVNHLLMPLVSAYILFVAVSGSAQTSPQTLKHPQGDFIVVNGARLWYESEGKGEPLLLIAGGPGYSHSYFHPFCSELADAYRVIYFDAFGRGKSDRAKSPKEYSFDRDVEDIEALRKALNLDKLVVLGHSYGGLVAQAYAVKYPASVKKLILSDSPYNAEVWQLGNDLINHEVRNQFPEIWEKVQQLRAQGLHSSAKEHQDAYWRFPLSLIFYYHPSNLGKQVFEFNADVYYQIAGDDADFLIGGDIVKLDFRVGLRNLQMPILILTGRFDKTLPPRLMLEYRRFAPEAEFVIFEQSGHDPFVEESSKYIEIMKRFLSK
jgi:proline iminopeptidase